MTCCCDTGISGGCIQVEMTGIAPESPCTNTDDYYNGIIYTLTSKGPSTDWDFFDSQFVTPRTGLSITPDVFLSITDTSSLISGFGVRLSASNPGTDAEVRTANAPWSRCSDRLSQNAYGGIYFAVESSGKVWIFLAEPGTRFNFAGASFANAFHVFESTTNISELTPAELNALSFTSTYYEPVNPSAIGVTDYFDQNLDVSAINFNFTACNNCQFFIPVVVIDSSESFEDFVKKRNSSGRSFYRYGSCDTDPTYTLTDEFEVIDLGAATTDRERKLGWFFGSGKVAHDELFASGDLTIKYEGGDYAGPAVQVLTCPDGTGKTEWDAMAAGPFGGAIRTISTDLTNDSIPSPTYRIDPRDGFYNWKTDGNTVNPDEDSITGLSISADWLGIDALGDTGDTTKFTTDKCCDTTANTQESNGFFVRDPCVDYGKRNLWSEQTVVFAIAETTDGGASWDITPGAMIKSHIPRKSIGAVNLSNGTKIPCSKSDLGDGIFQRYSDAPCTGKLGFTEVPCGELDLIGGVPGKTRESFYVYTGTAITTATSPSPASAASEVMRGLSSVSLGTQIDLPSETVFRTNQGFGDIDLALCMESENDYFDPFNTVELTVQDCDGNDPCKCNCDYGITFLFDCSQDGAAINQIIQDSDCDLELQRIFTQRKFVNNNCFVPGPAEDCEGCENGTTWSVVVDNIANDLCASCTDANQAYVVTTYDTGDNILGPPNLTYGAVCAGWYDEFVVDYCGGAIYRVFIQIRIQEDGYIEVAVCTGDNTPGGQCNGGQSKHALVYSSGDYPSCGFSGTSIPQVSYTTTPFCDHSSTTVSVTAS